MNDHVTVIPADNTIIVDGQALQFAFAAPGAMHALQWHEGRGEVEHTSDTPNTPLGPEEYAGQVQPFVEAWAAEWARLEEEASRPRTFEQTRLAKLGEINAGYSSVMGFVQAGYPDEEVLSWERQATQARELKADPNAEAAFVRTLAAVKGVAVQEMADRILANAESWEPVAAMLTAQRQMMEEAAYAAQTVAEIDAIRVGYTA